MTIILTTHYIEEAEEMADRIGVINKGELVLVEEKSTLMQKLGKKRLTLHLCKAGVRGDTRRRSAPYNLELSDEGCELTYPYDTKGERTGIHQLAQANSRAAGITLQGPRHHPSLAGRYLRQTW